MRKTGMLIRTLFLTGLVLGGVLLWFYAQQPPPPALLVQSTTGQAYLTDEDVVLPGEPIEAGDGLVVLDSPVNLVDPRFSSGLHLAPGSRFFLEWTGSDSDSDIFHARIQSGRGILRSSGSTHTLDFGPATYELTRGILAWKKTAETTLWTGKAEGKLSDNVEGLTVVEQAPPSDQFPDQAPLGEISPVSRKEQWYVGSIEPIDRVFRRMASTVDQTNRIPGSLLEGFGYWVRDRWGNVYLYRPNKAGFTLRSGGVDGKFFTEDDHVLIQE